jgi:hypothetical protein
MKIDCDLCGIEHASQAEADAMHGASKRIRRWMGDNIALSLQAVDMTPKKKIIPPVPADGSGPVKDRKKGCRGYGEPKQKKKNPGNRFGNKGRPKE